MASRSSRGRVSTPQNRPKRLLVASVVGALVLSYIPGAELLVYPLRIAVTFIHEGGHALMALLTGGHVRLLAVRPTGSGLTESLGGNPALVYMAGYLGAVLFGVACLHASRRASSGGRTMMGIGAVIGLLCSLWARDAFTLAAGIVLCIGLVSAGRYLPGPAADFCAAFLGVQFCLNALLDVRTLLLMTASTSIDNDAVFMAREFGLAPWFWALVWSAVSVTIVAVGLRAYWSGRRA